MSEMEAFEFVRAINDKIEAKLAKVKETQNSVKRDLAQCQKRPSVRAINDKIEAKLAKVKETQHSVKRELAQCQKRPSVRAINDKIEAKLAKVLAFAVLLVCC